MNKLKLNKILNKKMIKKEFFNKKKIIFQYVNNIIIKF